MRVTYDTTNTGGSAVVLSSLGDCEISGESIVREPAECPLRERHTLRLRLKFFEATFEANADKVASVRDALAHQQGKLTVEKESGTKYVDREVCVGDSDEPEEDRAPLAGTSRQGITLTFYWFVHLTSGAAGALAGTYQATGAGAPVGLGSVERWSERLTAERFDVLKGARRRVAGTVTASGWFTVDTSLGLAVRQNTLLAARAAVRAAVLDTPEGALVLGGETVPAFTRTVRVTDFAAEVNQPLARIDWTLAATFTEYPDEASFSLLEYTVSEREHYRDGAADLVLSGRIQAANLPAAQTRLAALKAATAASNYALVEEDLTPSYGASESGTGASDGTAWLALQFSIEWRRIGDLKPTFQRAGHALVALGAADRWSERYAAQLMDDLRDQRRRAVGTIEASGWFRGTSGTPTEAELVALKDAALAELTAGGTGTLTYGGFAQIVRVLDFTARVNQPKHRIEWDLVCTWTRFPNETNYAVVEYTVEDATDHVTGTSAKRLAGRIGAPTSAAARTKLEALRAQFARSTAYTLRDENTVERRVDADTDGPAFIELSFADLWARAEGDVVHRTVRCAETDELGSGWVRQVWSGTVTARGASQDTAYVTAAAQAATLGGGKAPFLLESTVQRVLPQLQTALNESLAPVQDAARPAALVTVEFSYAYKVKGTQTYVEYSVATQGEEFSRAVESVSGYVAAPSLAQAQAAYAALKSGWTNLLLNENTTESRQRLSPATEFFDRLQFSFTVHAAKSAVTASYKVVTEVDWSGLTRNTTVSGQVWAADEAAANAYLDGTLLPGLGALGQRVTSQRSVARNTGRNLAGATVAEVFIGLDFAEGYTAALSGYEGIVECAVTEDVTHSGTRWIEKPLPDGASVYQSAGTTAAERVVSGTVRALTRAACAEWAARCRRLLLVGPSGHEHAPRLVWGMAFARLVSGYPVAEGSNAANVQCHTLQFTFRESLAELAYA